MHKNVSNCKKQSKVKKKKFSTYPHLKTGKTWKNTTFSKSYSHYPHKNMCFWWITFIDKKNECFGELS